MHGPRKVLVVSASTRLANAVTAWLSSAGYAVSVVSSYPDAKAQLDQRPDAVITDLKLGPFNGLQLAIHAHASDIPAIALRVDDPVLRTDAQRLGVSYLSSDEVTGQALREALDAAWHVPSHGSGTGDAWAAARWSGSTRESTAGHRREVLH